MKKEVMARAVEDALEKATILTTAAKVTLGDIEVIRHSQNEDFFVYRSGINMSPRYSGAVYSASLDLSIDADDIEIEDEVDISWSIQKL